jgi:Tfp pilus assembly protein PilW
MLSSRLARRLIRDERGIGLVELLVGAVTGLILLGAMYSILEVSLHQSTRLTDYGQANQLARTSMTRIVDELHSACLATGFTPVQEGSTAKELIVINAYSEKTTIAPESVRKDKIVWNEAAKTLTDSKYVSNGGEWPKFLFPEKASAVTRIGEGVTQTENEKKEKVPVFKYFAYATKASTSSSSPSSTLNEAEPLTGEGEKGLNAKEAKSAASVLISFRTAPSSGSKEAARSADLSNQATFAFSAPNAEATIKAGPCE